jgi:hypothetical protein
VMNSPTFTNGFASICRIVERSRVRPKKNLQLAAWVRHAVAGVIRHEKMCASRGVNPLRKKDLAGAPINSVARRHPAPPFLLPKTDWDGLKSQTVAEIHEE